ncbi:MAG: protein kinase [Leptospiraceae bacterium]|nr:protein kinase [Leptospiraceae bacterium]
MLYLQAEQLFLDRYRVKRSLGEGSAGVVYQVVDEWHNRPCALKLIDIKRQQYPLEALLRFRQEAGILAELKHPGVIPYFGFIEKDEHYGIVTAWQEGSTLKEWIRQHPNPPLKTILAILRQLAFALQYVHNHSILHNDLKCTNILTQEQPQGEPQLRILDFGLSHLMEYQPRQFTGTLAYMAPEMTGILKKIIDHRSDLYSMGIIAWELCTGRLPFEASDPAILTHQHLAQVPQTPAALRADLPPALCAAILKLLAKEPAERYSSAAGFQRDLEHMQRILQRDERAVIDFPVAQEDHSISFPAENPLIGRERVLGDLEQFLLQSHEKIVLIESARGLGKSSLLREFFNRSQVHSHRKNIFFRPHQSENMASYSGLGGILRGFIEHLESLDPDAQQQLLQDLQHDLGADVQILLQFLPELERWLEQGPMDVGSRDADRILQTCQKLVRFYYKRGQQVLLLIDGLHFIDESSLHLLHQLSQSMKAKRLLIVATYNRELLSGRYRSLVKQILEDRHTREIALTPLSHHHLAALLQSLFSNSLIDLTRLLDPLMDASGGNPRRLRTMLQDMVDQQILYYEERSLAWQCDFDRLADLLSSSANQDHLAVLRSFTPDELEILKRGAIFQRAFSIQSLQSLLEERQVTSLKELENLALHNQQVLQTLDKARNTGILSLNADQLYSFRDMALRRQLHESIDLDARNRMHRTIAVFLKRNFLRHNPNTVYDLAYHYQSAQDYNKTAQYYFKAGRLNQDENWSSREAQLYYNLAAELVRGGRADALQKELQFDILFCSALFNYNIHPDARSMAADIAGLQSLQLDQAFWQLRLHYLQANHAFLTGNRGELRSHAEEVVRIGRDLQGESRHFYLQGLSLLGIVPTGLDYQRRVAILTEVLDCSIREQRLGELDRVLTIMVNLLAYLGKFGEARDWIQKAGEAFDLHENGSATLRTYFAMRMLEIESGRFSDFEFQNANMESVVAEMTPMARSFLEAHRGRVHAMRGEYKQALAIFDELLGSEAGDARQGGHLLAIFGRMVLANRMYDYEGALDWFGSAQVQLKRRPDPYKDAEISLEALRSYVALGLLDKAREQLEHAQKVAASLDLALLQAHITFQQARLEWSQGDRQTAEQRAQDCIAEMHTMGASGWADIYSSELHAWHGQSRQQSSSGLSEQGGAARELYQLLQINRQISSMLDRKSLLREVLQGAMRITGAQHGYLFLCAEHGAKQNHQEEASLSLDSLGKGIPVAGQTWSHTIVDYCLRTEQSVITREARNEERWQVADSISNQKMRSILVVPIKHQDRLQGILYLDNHAASSVFTGQDQEIVEHYAIQAAIAMSNARLFEQEQASRKRMQSTLDIFEKFIPRQFTDRFAEGDVAQLEPGLAREEDLAILFADIRNFTSLAESMTASDLFLLLNDYLKFMELPIRQSNGFVDKYIGDAIMAIFDHSEYDAVRAAIGMQRAMHKLNYRRQRKGLVTLRSGIGIHCGPGMIGVIGSRERIDTTVMGDVVNTAARIESLTKEYGASILISEDVHHATRHRENLDLRFIDRVQLKGRTGSHNIYEVFNSDPDEVRSKKAEMQKQYRECFELYQKANWADAVRAWRSYLNDFPVDSCARLIYDRVLVLKKYQPEIWDGIYQQQIK